MAFSIQKGRSSRKHRLNSEINVTPFVDVMLVLLVIFMVTSPMLISGIDVDLPKTKSSPVHGNDEPIVVTIDKSGIFYLQEMQVSGKKLKLKLQAATKENKEARIFVRGDQGVYYGKVIELFMTIKESGFHNVSLVTEIKNEDAKN